MPAVLEFVSTSGLGDQARVKIIMNDNNNYNDVIVIDITTFSIYN